MTVFYYFAYSVGMLFAIALSPFLPKVRKGIVGRLGLVRRLSSQGPWDQTIWIHVASAGEIEQAIPIFENLRAKEKNARLLLTYFSPSAIRAIDSEVARREKAGEKLPWDVSDYAPFDLPFFVNAFMAITRPRVFVSINREIWPGILSYCAKENVPALLLSTFVPKSRQRAIQKLAGWAKLFRYVGTVDIGTMHFLNELLPSVDVVQVGDSRVERVLSRQKLQVKAAPWRDFFAQDRPIFIAASVWGEDMEALKPSLQFLASRGWRLLIVPHERDERFLRSITTWGNSAEIPLRYWSHWLKSPDLDSSLVINAVGFLAELYQVASLVFVGGSFRSRIHNILEPMGYGVPVVMGPHIWNSAQACEWQSEECRSVPTPEALLQAISELDRARADLPRLGQKAKARLLEASSAGIRYADLVLKEFY